MMGATVYWRRISSVQRWTTRRGRCKSALDQVDCECALDLRVPMLNGSAIYVQRLSPEIGDAAGVADGKLAGGKCPARPMEG